MPATATGVNPYTGETAPKHAVLLAGNFLSTVGSRGVCEELAAQLAAAGRPVITASARPERLGRMADMVTTAWRERARYDVAHVDVFSGAAFVWAEAVTWTLRRAARPYVLTLHGGNLPAFARRWPRRVRRLLRSAHVVTTPSRYLLETMRPYREDLHLLPNPLDLGAYRFRLRREPRPTLVWLRAFHGMYNPSLVPRVLALLAPDVPDVHVTMVGPDKGDGSLADTQRVAAELGVAGRISYAGHIPKSDVPAYLDRGDIFLNTTNVDNTPVSVMEAMACGLCVVSTNVGGLPYLLTDCADALLVPRDDPAALAAAVRRVLREPGLAGRLSQRARAAAERWDWAQLLPHWERLLDSVAERRARSAALDDDLVLRTPR